MSKRISILSGTRDELGGVELGIVNVYARDEKPGGLSGQLVLEGGDQIIGIGDKLRLGGKKFRLLEIEAHRTGAHVFHFEDMAEVPVSDPAKSSASPIPPVSAAALESHLKKITPDILGLLGGGRFEITAWKTSSTDSMTTEWNGMQSGPSTHVMQVAVFSSEAHDATECTLRRDTIRYDPHEIYRQEVSAFWRVADKSAHVFARGEGEQPISEIWASDLPGPVLALIRNLPSAAK